MQLNYQGERAEKQYIWEDASFRKQIVSARDVKEDTANRRVRCIFHPGLLWEYLLTLDLTDLGGHQKVASIYLDLKKQTESI